MKEVVMEYSGMILGVIVAGLLSLIVWSFLKSGGVISNVVLEFINGIC